LDELDFMRLHLETLFVRDAAGRLVSHNAPLHHPAPRFVFGRTARGNVWAFRNDLSEGLVRELEALATREAAFLESAPSDPWAPYLTVIGRAAEISRTWTGPAFRFPDNLPECRGTVLVNTENAHVLSPFLEDWTQDAAGPSPLFADLDHGHAVSACCGVRITSRAEEAGVATHADFRGRGHGARVVTAWAGMLRSQERTPLYSTSWVNQSSRRLASRIGLLQYGSTFHVT